MPSNSAARLLRAARPAPARLNGELHVLPAVSHGISAASWNIRATRDR